MTVLIKLLSQLLPALTLLTIWITRSTRCFIPGFWGAVKAYTVFGAQLATDAIEMRYYLYSVAPGATVQTVKAVAKHLAKPLTHRIPAK